MEATNSNNVKWQYLRTFSNFTVCGSGRDHVCRTNSTAEKRPWLKALFRECAAHSKSGPLARHEFTMESNAKVQIGQYESLILNRTPWHPFHIALHSYLDHPETLKLACRQYDPARCKMEQGIILSGSQPGHLWIVLLQVPLPPVPTVLGKSVLWRLCELER